MNQASQDELTQELFLELWENSQILKDTRREAEEWFHYIKAMIITDRQKAVTEAKYEAIRNHYDAKYLAQVVNDYLDIRKQELNDLEATLTNQDRSTE